jgi:hypothetical protein
MACQAVPVVGALWETLHHLAIGAAPHDQFLYTVVTLFDDACFRRHQRRNRSAGQP